MTSTIFRGLLAGAAGTALLTATTYADMALTGRGASTAPQQSVAELFRRAGRKVPDDNVLTGLGELSGIATGVGIGVVAAALRAAGVRLPATVGAPAVGALAMAVTDLSIAGVGVSDTRRWTAADWARDVVPHLAYGVGVRAVLDATEPRTTPVVTAADQRGTHQWGTHQRTGRPRVLARSLLIGLASGGRSSLGFLAAGQLAGKPAVTAASLAAVAGEMTLDKLPSTPSRLQPGPLLGRAGAGAVGGVAVARRAGANVVLPAAVGLAGAVAGSVLGAAWREVAGQRGWTWPAAIAEDAVSVALAWGALR